MTRIAALVLAALFLAGSAQAQQPAPPDRFVDVPEDHWAYRAVENLRKRGVIVGYPDGRLRGKRTVTRYEAATGLNRFVAEADKAIQQKRTTAVPALRGTQGARGERGPQGPAGPPGERPREIDLFRELSDQIRAEITELRKRLDEVEKQAGETESKVKK